MRRRLRQQEQEEEEAAPPPSSSAEATRQRLPARMRPAPPPRRGAKRKEEGAPMYCALVLLSALKHVAAITQPVVANVDFTLQVPDIGSLCPKLGPRCAEIHRLEHFLLLHDSAELARLFSRRRGRLRGGRRETARFLLLGVPRLRSCARRHIESV